MTFWEIHPGVSRPQALRPLGDHVTYGIGFLVTALVTYVLSLRYWYWTSAWMTSLALFLLMIGLAAWLLMAVRWVDRHGLWGGEYRSPESIENRAVEE